MTVFDPASLIQNFDSRAARYVRVRFNKPSPCSDALVTSECRVFTGFAFCLSTVGVNISANSCVTPIFLFKKLPNPEALNSVSFATDAMALCPRYLDLFRGAILSAILAVALTPWNWSDATAFVAFLYDHLHFHPLPSLTLHALQIQLLSVAWLYRRHYYNRTLCHSKATPLHTKSLHNLTHLTLFLSSYSRNQSSSLHRVRVRFRSRFSWIFACNYEQCK